MGIQEMALLLLGVGIISEQFGGGAGLQSLGAGVQALVSAPLTGTGAGLSSLATGFKDIATSLGDIGRGLSALFASIPRGPITGIPFSPISGNGNGILPAPGPPGAPLITMGGGDDTTGRTGGGGNVPKPILPSPPTRLPSGPILMKPILFAGGSTRMGAYDVF